jgi:rubredoxin
VGVEQERFQGWACSVCAWIFRGSGALDDKSIEEMKRQYEAERDKAFKSHVCVAHPRERGALH